MAGMVKWKLVSGEQLDHTGITPDIFLLRSNSPKCHRSLHIGHFGNHSSFICHSLKSILRPKVRQYAIVKVHNKDTDESCSSKFAYEDDEIFSNAHQRKEENQLRALESYFSKLNPKKAQQLRSLPQDRKRKSGPLSSNEGEATIGNDNANFKTIGTKTYRTTSSEDYKDFLILDDKNFLDMHKDDQASSFFLTNLLAAINIAVLLFEIASPVKDSENEYLSLPLMYGAKINNLILSGEWWRLLTPMCLHSGFLHVTLGCWVLLTFGPRVCRAYGQMTFFLIYILGGLCGNLTSFVHTPELTVCGTGPVFSVIGAWLVYQSQNKQVIDKDVSEIMFWQAVIAAALSFLLSIFAESNPSPTTPQQRARAMERLISSSPLLRRAPVAAASRPRTPRPSFVASPPCRGGGLGLRPLLARHRAPSSPVPAASGGPAAPSAAAAAESEGDVASATRRRFFQKVTSAAVVTLLSAVILTLIQPAALVPPALAHFHPTVKAGTTLFKSELLGSAWTGFLAGCLHTLSGPDHLAALAPLSIGRSRVESAFVGALWGCGHDAGQVIFGLLFLSLKDRLHIEIIRTWSTRVVALTLLIIGALGIREATEVPTPCVALENGECDVSVVDHHRHRHHPVEALPGGKKKINFATFATGIVHGLQPDALMMVLPALALPSRVAGAAFLGMFLVGTVVSMGSYTVLIGSCTEALKERVPRITEKLTWAASLVAISMGLAIFISQSFGFTLY